jgi:tetratricopeptide (TPR) repeat protein
MPPPSENIHPASAKATAQWGWMLVALILIGLAIGLVVGGRKLFNRYKSHQAELLANAALKDMDEERWEAAAIKIKDALTTYPEQPAVLRASARMIADGYSDYEQSASMLRKLLSSGQGTPTDLIHLATALLKSGAAEQAQKIYDSLSPEARRTSEGMELLANIYYETGRANEALSLLRKALSSDPENPRSQLRLAVMDLHLSGLEEARKSVAATLWKLAARQDRVGLDAIGQINDMPELTATQVRELRRLVEAHPLVQPKHRYAVLTNYLRLIPLERDEIITAEVTAQQGKAMTTQFDFLRWLGLQKEHERILQKLPRHVALRDPDIFRVYVDALAAGERWTEILNLMRERVPVAKTTATFILARATAEVPAETALARQYLHAVFATAGPVDTSLVVQAASVAEEKGHADLAIEGYTRAMNSRARLKVPMLEKIFRLHQRLKNVEGIISTLKLLIESRPSHPDYAALLAYYRLITGIELELAWTQPAVTSEQIPLPVLKALTAISQGQAEVALEGVKSLTDVSQLDAGIRAVVSGLWAMGKDDIRAYRIAEAVPSSLLLPQEEAFRQMALR